MEQFLACNPYEINLLFKRLEQSRKGHMHTKKLHQYVRKIHTNIRGMKQKCQCTSIFYNLVNLQIHKSMFFNVELGLEGEGLKATIQQGEIE